MQYEKLSDCSLFDSGDNAEIWYMRPECFRPFSFGDMAGFDPHNIGKTHIHLGSIGNCDSPDEIFCSLQGENWSPEGEARNLIKSKGLNHTSMSVGDVIVFKDRIAMVLPVGFSFFVR